MHDTQILQVITALRCDLPGDPIGYIEAVAPHSKQCKCGSVHLSVDDKNLGSSTASSLHRVLATPYGDIVREYMRRREGYENIRFGWQGIQNRAPNFMRTVELTDTQSANAGGIGSSALKEIVQAISQDMPEVFRMIEGAVQTPGKVFAVSAGSSNQERIKWQSLINHLMFVWSTPIRKYLDEWLMREYGLYGGAINCCIVMTDYSSDHTSWRRRWMSEQTAQQITPDC